MQEGIRWWEGVDRHGEPWVEWRRVNGARGGRGRTTREAVVKIWALYGPAWVSSVMLNHFNARGAPENAVINMDDVDEGGPQ
jgi:hypothetical protein